MKLPYRDGLPPLWREARLGLELAALLRDPQFRFLPRRTNRERRGHAADGTEGQPVLLIPGYLAGDDSLGVMTSWLRRTGRRPHRAGIRWNVGCSAQVVETLLVRLEEIAARADRPVAIVGQSRGGLFARVLAVRKPELVSGIVTLGSAHLDPMAVHPLVRLQIHALGLIGTLGAPGVFSASCIWGRCCQEVGNELAGPFPEEVDFVSVYSRTDGIVDWRRCLDPAARSVEIESSHCGMAAHPHAYREIDAALTSFERKRPVARALGV